jgi:hypothetical protein
MSRAYYLGTACVGDHRLSYEAVLQQPRLRITMTGPALGQQGTVLGSVVALDTEAPRLRVSAPLHLEWATANSESIIDAAVEIWNEVRRDCDG